MNSLKLSIITPVFNSINYIEQCIENVIQQNCLSNVEHLIMDGGSTDGTLEVIKKNALKYHHIKYVSEKDKGQSDAMNKGIQKAEGEFISFLNVDDYYEKGALNSVLNHINNRNEVDCFVGNCNVWDENGKLIYINKPSKLKTWHILSGYYLPVNPSAYFYKKKLHEKIGGYDIHNHYVMDIDVLLKISLVTNMFYVNEIWGNFRMLPETKTVQDNLKGTSIVRKIKLFKKYKEELPLKYTIRTLFVKVQKFFSRYFYRLNKLMKFPFELIYFKIKKEYEAFKKI